MKFRKLPAVNYYSITSSLISTLFILRDAKYAKAKKLIAIIATGIVNDIAVNCALKLLMPVNLNTAEVWLKC